jgi:uncharacterized membrane protein YhaH (DUF805 family)
VDEDRPVEDLSLFGYFVKCLKCYAVFDGRARRMELCGYFLFRVVIGIAWPILCVILLGSLDGSWEGIILTGLPNLAFLTPELALFTRRLHDIGKSGRLFLRVCVLFYGFLVIAIVVANVGYLVLAGIFGLLLFGMSVVLLIFFAQAFFIDSKPGSNPYGPSPKYPNGKWQSE